MRRGLIEGDFPLQLHGTAIFSATDPVPLVVFATVDEADTVFRLISIGYDVSAIVARSAARGLPAMHVGDAVIALFERDAEPERDPELPFNPPTPEGWTLDGTVK